MSDLGLNRSFDIAAETGVNRGAVLASGTSMRVARLHQDIRSGTATDGSCDHTIVYLFGGPGVDRSYEGRHDKRIDAIGVTTVMPAGRSSEWQSDAVVDVLHLYLDDTKLKQFVRETLDRDPAQLEVRDLMGVDDKTIAALAPVVSRALVDQGGTTRLLLDGMEQVLVARIIDGFSNFTTTKALQPEQHPLGTALVDKVVSFMRDRLDEDLALADYAALTSMSTFQFARAFKAATGQTPHQMLISERVSRASSLLARSQLSLAEIAYDCGFSSQSHLTSTFSKQMGMPPGQYRKEFGA